MQIKQPNWKIKQMHQINAVFDMQLSSRRITCLRNNVSSVSEITSSYNTFIYSMLVTLQVILETPADPGHVSLRLKVFGDSSGKFKIVPHDVTKSL